MLLSFDLGLDSTKVAQNNKYSRIILEKKEKNFFCSLELKTLSEMGI